MIITKFLKQKFYITTPAIKEIYLFARKCITEGKLNMLMVKIFNCRSNKAFIMVILGLIITLSMTGCLSFYKRNSVNKDFSNLNYISDNIKIVQEIIVTYKKISLSGIMITKFSNKDFIESIFLAPSGIKLMEFTIEKNKFKKITFFTDFKGTKHIFKKILEIFLTTYSDYKIIHKPLENTNDGERSIYKFGKKKNYYIVYIDEKNRMIKKTLIKNNKDVINIEYKDFDEKYVQFPSTIIYENYKDKIKIIHNLKDIMPIE